MSLIVSQEYYQETHKSVYSSFEKETYPNTTLQTLLTQIFLLLLSSKHEVPSMTASNIFSENCPSTGRQ